MTKHTTNTYKTAGSFADGEQLVEFIKNNATYQYVTDAKLFPELKGDSHKFTKVLVVKRFEIEIAFRDLEVLIPDDAFPKTDPNGINDTTSTTLVLFDRCRFVKSPVAKCIGMKFTGSNVAFRKCNFYSHTVIGSTYDMTFIDCHGHYTSVLSVYGIGPYSSATFSHMSTCETDLKICGLQHAVFDQCQFVNSPSIKDCRAVTMTSVSGYGFYCEGLYGTMYTCGDLSMSGCHLTEVSVTDSICSVSAEGSEIRNVSAARCVFGHVDLSNSDTKSFIPKRCVFTGANLGPVATFPSDCSGLNPESLENFTLYKKVNLWKGLAALCPSLAGMIGSALETLGRTKHEPPSIIAKLTVPPTAKRVYSASHKVRVSEAVVERFFAVNKSPDSKETLVPIDIPRFASVRSVFDPSFRYRAGKIVRPKKKFSDSPNPCNSGIHGFLTPEEAINYGF